MYNLNILDICDIQPTWNDIYYGVTNKLLDLECVREYAIRCLGLNHKCPQEVSELAWYNDDVLDVIKIMEKILGEEINSLNYEATIKWQYCIIKSLLNDKLSFEDLTSKLDEIYADFDYPEDMEEFVSYMPVKDSYMPIEHSREENIKRILDKVDNFLIEKKSKLNS